LLLAALPVLGQTGGSQTPILYDSTHNATPITGTWSTGSGAVSTGSGFANPVNFSFTYPKTTGRSFSFTDDGFFEQAEYRFSSNASDPHCITGVVTFQHGKYDLLSNGSILLNPFAVDGRQQVQDPCAAVSNQLTQWNTTVLFLQWRIFPLPSGGNHLNLYEFDGTPVAPMNLIANPPNMLPTQVLTQNSS
ncbi:chaperone for protein-folding within the ER, fungal-domain-containing protein, partial [Gautieria morchelliformis]